MNIDEKSSYYLIVQRVGDFKYTNKIEEPTDATSIKKIVNCLVGNISVFLYNYDNSVKDFTQELGKFEKDIDIEKLYIIKRVKYSRIQSIENNSQNVGEFFLTNLLVYTEQYLPKTLVFKEVICKQHALSNMMHFSDYINDNPEENQRKIDAGSEYEKYVATKYIDTGHTIIYHGIDKKTKDGGIDLIAQKDNKTILIQCKNWRMAGYKEIKSKDIRAFFGDAFKYLLDNNLMQTKVAFHFIVADEESLGKDAMYYLQENTSIKYKCIPFTKNIVI